MNHYVFNYTNAPNLQPWGEINNMHDVYFKVEKHAHFNIYFIDNHLDNNNELINIPEDTNILLISTSNSAHSISEIISFIQYYGNNTNKIALS